MEDLKWNPVKQAGVVDLGHLVSHFISHVALYKNPLTEEYGVLNLFRSITNQGVFFRSPLNRRQKNYWLPAECRNPLH